MAATKVKGVHLLGSIPVDSEEDAFRRACQALPTQLKRLPDGEPQSRFNFIFWQLQYFLHEPRVLDNPNRSAPYTEDQEEDVLNSFRNFETHYEDYALKSYDTFKKLREEGVIPAGVRFQVCLPTPVTVVAFIVKPVLRDRIELIYRRAILKSLNRIQEKIPASDLAIQWDVVTEVLMPESEPNLFTAAAWFTPLYDGIIERLAFLVDSVAEGVEVGLHLCYGDKDHKHFIEPPNLGVAVELANGVISKSKRAVEWIHMPVPKERKDHGYFAPLQNFKGDQNTTDVVLGLVHYGDLEGTKTRIEVAGEYLQSFLVATECGMGRTPREQLDDIFSISAAIREFKARLYMC